jgi:formylglycine-generating enzyme required for sulfatase activity
MVMCINKSFVFVALLVVVFAGCSLFDTEWDDDVLGIQFITVIDSDESGVFTMGNADSDRDEETYEHEVTLTRAYAISKYEITHAEFIEFLNGAGVDSEGELNEKVVYNLSGTYSAISYEEETFSFESESVINDSDCPVVNVSWYGAASFCNWLSSEAGLEPAYDTDKWTCDYDASGYQLPSEAEWEYASRGGAKSKGFSYSGSDSIDSVAWYGDNSYDLGSDDPDYGIHTVGEKASNELGIFDMSGNAYEWCNDFYDGSYYENSVSTNPRGGDYDSYYNAFRILRGGCWTTRDSYSESTHRLGRGATRTNQLYGFRIIKPL